jgi:hypothetical protein
MRFIRSIIPLFALVLMTGAAGAQTLDQVARDKAEYQRSNITRYFEMFKAQDFNRSDRVTWQEVQGNVEFMAVFNDIDINRDGIVTKAELERYLTLRFGYAPPK